MFSNYPDVVTVNDIQKMLGVSKTSAYMLVKDNIIKTVRIGKKYIIPKQSVINYLSHCLLNEVDTSCYNHLAQ